MYRFEGRYQSLCFFFLMCILLSLMEIYLSDVWFLKYAFNGDRFQYVYFCFVGSVFTFCDEIFLIKIPCRPGSNARHLSTFPRRSVGFSHSQQLQFWVHLYQLKRKKPLVPGNPQSLSKGAKMA